MNVYFASYQSVMLLKGGPKTQIIQTKKELEKLGVNVNFFETWKELNKEKCDLFHLFGANIGTYHLAREIHKTGIPMVVTPIFFSLHSTKFLRTALYADKFVRKVFHGLWMDYGFLHDICNWAEAVLPNTECELKLLEEGLSIPIEKQRVIPNGVEEKFYNADGTLFRNKYGVNKFILNVGHIGPARKNVLRLIRAVDEIETPIVIIGRIENNSYGNICIEEAKKNPNILIIDALANDSELLASAYGACDVFVLPSLFETPGIAALEAALAGAKIVITKYGGTEEYFGKYAEYVEPTSTASIRRGILDALQKEKQPLLREHIKKEFLWSNVAKKTLDVYKNVLDKK